MAQQNLPLVFAELLAAGVLIFKGAKMFGGAFGGDSGSPAGQAVEELGQAASPSASGAPPIAGSTGLAAVVRGADELARALPAYVWGGGHGTNALSGADCSGAISYVLNRAGLLKGSLTSSGFMSWGDPGQGQAVTVWANSTHVIMSVKVKGVTHWFGTSGFGHPNAPNGTGANWFTVSPSAAYLSAFTPRHPPGL